LIATCAVRNDDSVVCWGDNVSGELNGANSLSGSLTNDPYNYDPQVMPGLTNVAHVVMGDKHACAVTWDDHVLCWGSNSIGQLGVPSDGGFSPTPVTPTSF
jgi:alpha-tubulin suppressor-like RCC1 family protein